MRAVAGLALACGLAACSSTPTYPPPPPPAPPPAAAETPPPRPVPSPPRSPVPRAPQVSARDQCGAAELQGLVGRPRAEIPVPLDPGRQRVACTRCPVAEDFNPARLNFFFDADTGLIQQVRCG